MLQFLDAFLWLLHVAVVLANLFLWIPKRTRPWHLVVVGLTFTSWVAVGPLLGYGFGYCFLTDWHWDVKRALGEQNLPGSFIVYWFRQLGIDASAWANTLTLTVFAGVTLLSLALNLAPLVKGKPRVGS